jgi:hypothetical protein
MSHNAVALLASNDLHEDQRLTTQQESIAAIVPQYE